jgi:phage terminase large subunit GpA-like protein
MTLEAFEDLNFADARPGMVSNVRLAEDISIRDHAEKNLYLAPGKNPFPGLVDFSKTPYLYEPLEALQPDNGVEKVVIMKGWQTGGTLTGLAWTLWVMDSAPAYMLIVQPNDELRKTFSQHRINPIIAHCKSLKEKIHDEVRGDKLEKDSILTKSFPGGCLFLGTALSSSALRSHSFQNVMFDEVSAYPADTQKYGDPCGLAIGRTSAYEGRKKLLFVSTPSLAGKCRIEAEYLLTDQRKYFVPCLSCGHMQLILEEGLDFSIEIPVFRCVKCRYAHYEQDKSEMLRLGQWQPTATPKISNARGYHLPALYAPPGMWSWRSTREQLLKGVDNPEEKKVYVNNCLGLPYEDSTITSLDPKDIRNCEQKDWPAEADRAPKGCSYITVGVDTHPLHLSVVVVGWGRKGERWIIDHQRIQGDTNHEPVWLELLCILQREYIHWHSTNRKTTLGIAATCIDTGGHNTAAVYSFCYGREHQNIMPIKGSRDRSAPITGPIVVKNFKIQNIEHKIHLLPVGKLATHGRLFSCLSQSVKKLEEIRVAARNGSSIPYEGPGLIHFRPGLGDGFYRELTAPKAKWVRRDGRDQLTYETTPGVDDHVHDCIRYADAAREFQKQDIDVICDRTEKLALERNAL